MAVCRTWTYRNVTEAVFQSLRTQASKQGFSVPNASSGTFAVQAGGMSVQFEFAWNRVQATLQLACIRKPVLVSCTLVKSMADQIIQQSGGTPA